MSKTFLKTLILSLCLVCAFALAKSVGYAAPADSSWQTVTQPSGETFMVSNRGDENFHWVIADDGSVVEKSDDGYWYDKEMKNGKPEKSSVRHKKSNNKSGNLSEAKLLEWSNNQPVLNSANISGELNSSSVTSNTNQLSLTAPAATTTLANGTNRKVLVILASFNNRNLTFSDSAWNSRVFGTSGSTVKNYYNEVSGGKLVLVPAEETSGTSNDGVVRVSVNQPHPYYTPVNPLSGSKNDFDNEILTAAAPYVDFSSFDTNNDGGITRDELLIIMVAAGYEESICSNTPGVWSHWSYNYGLLIDNVYITGKSGNSTGGYAYVGEIHNNHMATIGTICHELGHSLGLPDLYDVHKALPDCISQGVGIHSLMAGGSWGRANTQQYLGSCPSHLDAWSKVQLGFVTPTVVDNCGTFSVRFFGASGGYNVLRINTANPNQYFLVENREFYGFDSSLALTCPYAGIAIWHIDESKATTINRDNSIETNKRVDIEEANEGALGYSQLDNEFWATGADGKPYYYFNETNYCHYYSQGTGYTNFSYNTTPNSALYDGTATQLSINTLSSSSTSMNVEVTRNLPTRWGYDDSFSDTYFYIHIGGLKEIEGWFLDGAGVNKIETLVDGTTVSTANYGVSSSYYSEQASILYPEYCNPKSLFSTILDVTQLMTYGNHTIRFKETSNNGTVTYTDPVTVMALPTMGYIDSPANNQTVSGTLNVCGWMLSADNIWDRIEILVDGSLMGVADYWLSRPDVLNAYPGYSNDQSGFSYNLNTNSLANGTHTIVARMVCGDGRYYNLSSRTFITDN